MAGPYQRDVYDSSRGTARIADLIARRGETQARLALQRGDIAARTASDLAGIATNTIGSLVQRSAQQKAQKAADARQAEADERRRVMEGRQDEEWQQRQAQGAAQGAESAAKNRALIQKPDGTWGYDMDLLASSLKEAGLAERLPAIRASIMEIEDATIRHQAAKAGLDKAVTDALARSARAVMIASKAGLDPVQAFSTEADRLLKNGVVSEADLEPIREAAKDPKSVMGVLSQVMARGGLKVEDDKPEDGIVSVSPGAALYDKKTGKVVYSNPREFAPTRPPADPNVITARDRNNATRWRDREFSNINTDARRQIEDKTEELRKITLDSEGKPVSNTEFEARNRNALEEFKAKVYKSAQRRKEDVVASYKSQLNAPEDDMESVPSATPPSGMVKMRLPDGREGFIPKANVQKAKAAGAVEVR